ncbi:MAG: hypothetical protein F4065_01280 [Rhodothermaceae bacterium]|nr:hypothetical protein [Rhodothermaceae bacterium]MXZ57031.1 hypothetical protein [Rhodothermaceae bacterium]MYB90765.1 hypothetical protein [Rhodothermaceae bacterium]MYD68678.1 hypothetical protein [Rhodothermaceae bacterium]MYG45267.1 hypothetical protein [Rhodothermaceae bacterium]
MIRILIGLGTAIILHLILGWAWSIGGGIAAGMYCRRRAWLAGGIAVGLGWALFVAHTFIVAPEPTIRLLAIMGAMFGGLPGALIPVVTVFVGGLLGVVGGALGASMNPVLTPLWNQLRSRFSQRSHSAIR